MIATAESEGSMEYRVENKYLVTDADLALLAGRLSSVMSRDIHQEGSSYEVRSVYFDDAWDRCLDENEAGVDQRQKYRIRTYGADSQVIHLEIKEKVSGLTRKESCGLTRQETKLLINGTLPLTLGDRKPLNLLQMQMRCSHMEPKVIISYERTAFVYPAGNVRITFDRNITACDACTDFFQHRIWGAVPVLPSGMHVLEVKYDELLPDFVAKQLEIRTLRQSNFSKYYLGRLAMQGEFPVDR